MAARCSWGGKPRSGPARSKPTTPAPARSAAASAARKESGSLRMASTMIPQPTPVTAAPLAMPAITASRTSTGVRPSLVWRSGANRCSVYTTPSAARSTIASSATRESASGLCMTAIVCSKRPEVALQRPARTSLVEPVAQLVLVVGRQARVARRAGELDDRPGPEPPVEVVVGGAPRAAGSYAHATGSEPRARQHTPCVRQPWVAEHTQCVHQPTVGGHGGLDQRVATRNSLRKGNRVVPSDSRG
jgi:hypothetical protein